MLHIHDTVQDGHVMKEQVLIVEDEHDTVELLRYNLQKESYQTVVARTGAEAISAVQSHMPDIVLLDIMLPELSGWDVCRMLRESATSKSVPIIMLTALSAEDARIKALTLGADDFLSKPFSLRELLLKVKKLLDRQRTIRRLQAKEREHDTSMRYLVHELKNSMNVIGGFSALGLRKEEVQEYLRAINVAAAHAESLLNNASLLFQLEQQRGSLPVCLLDIGKMVEDMVIIFRDMAGKSGGEIVLANNASSLIMGNSTAIRQVLINLLSNAIKYNRYGGKVWIKVEEANKQVIITIKDEGGGIPRDEIPKIFDKFYRGAGSEQIKGAGLGLYIVKLLMEAMGGKIMAASTPGDGSMFSASFPRPDSPGLNTEKDGHASYQLNES
jgi:signal transduction histidine kinase